MGPTRDAKCNYNMIHALNNMIHAYNEINSGSLDQASHTLNKKITLNKYVDITFKALFCETHLGNPTCT